MKWVTKQNIIFWIFLGLGIVFFGICMGIWKDRAEENKNKNNKNKTKKIKEALTDNTSKTTDTMFQYLTENYSDDEKIRMLSQMPELMDGKDHNYNAYNYVLKDSKMTNTKKVESLKQKIAMTYYIPTFLKTPNECMNNYIIPLGFTDPKIKQILSEKKNITDTLNTLQIYLKKNNF